MPYVNKFGMEEDTTTSIQMKVLCLEQTACGPY